MRVERDDTNKIESLTDNTAICYSGSEPFGYSLIRDIKEKIKPTDNLETILEVSGEIYREHWRKIACIKILQPNGFKSFNQFQKRKIDEELRKQLQKELKEFISPIDLLIIGKGSNGYEMHTVQDPGIWEINPKGYTVLGKGGDYAIETLMKYFDSSSPKTQVKKVLKKAKTEAEKDDSVGEKTDWGELPEL